MDVSVLEAERDDADAASLLHEQVQREVLDEVLSVVVQRLQEEEETGVCVCVCVCACVKLTE